jgi:hypothetical protein
MIIMKSLWVNSSESSPILFSVRDLHQAFGCSLHEAFFPMQLVSDWWIQQGIISREELLGAYND